MNTPTFSLPDAQSIHHTRFPNGVTLLVYENSTTASVAIKGSLRAGMIYETPEKNGLASLTASLLTSGTITRDFETLHSTLEDIGAELHVESSKSHVSFEGRALSEDLAVLLRILADALRNPTFPQAEVEEEVTKRMTELNFGLQNTRYMAARAFREALYPPEHPYHYANYGSLQSLPRIQRSDVQAFHARQYGPEGLILVVVGAVEPSAVIAQVGEFFGDWSNPHQAPRPTIPHLSALERYQRVQFPVAGKGQSDIMLGTVGPTRYSPDYRPATLVNSILGEFGMMGRVGLIIREKLGLAYYAYSHLEGGSAQGSWTISIGVAKQNVELAIEKAREEIARIATEWVSADDLADNQSYFIGRLPLRLESNTGLAHTLHTMERYELGLDYLVQYAEGIASLTRAELLACAQTYWHPERLVVAVAGS